MLASRLLWFTGFLASLQLVVIGCGPNRPWPTVGAQADSRFANHRVGVRTVDVLPLDFQVWGHDPSVAPEAIQRALQGAAHGALQARLAERGYRVVAPIGWDGRYAAASGAIHQAMTPEETAMTAEAMSSYGYAVAQADQGLLVPYLPARLGVHTGSDATLHVGGWAYVGQDDESSTGDKVLKGIAIGLAIVFIVAIVAIALSSKGDSSSKSSSSGRSAGRAGTGSGGAVRVAGRRSGGAVRVAGRGSGRSVRVSRPTSGRVVARPGGVTTRVGRVAGRVSRGGSGGNSGGGVGVSVARGGARVLRGAAHVGNAVVRGMWHAVDAMGRSATHIHIYGDGSGDVPPDYYERDDAPGAGPSQMYVEMTLIDNHTGLALWHARHTFPANATRPEHVGRVFELLLATLPAQ